MENTGNPSLKENHFRKLVYFHADFIDEHSQLFESCVHLSSDIKNQSIFLVGTLENKIEIYDCEKKQFIYSSKANFVFIINQLITVYRPYEKQSVFTSQNLTTLSKNKYIWNQSHFLLSKLNSIFLESNTTEEFIHSLFDLDFLKNFKTFHSFIHEKGTISARHTVHSRAQDHKFNQSISEFTSLLSSIKKSKNRSFGQSTLKASNFQIIGTCLAKEFSLQRYNFIFIVSKDDFLAQTEEDIEQFNSICEHLKSYFELILAKEFNRNKISQIRATLDHLPISIKAHKEDQIIYASSSELKLENLITKNNFSLYYQKHVSAYINQADVHHHERISLLGELLNTLKHELSNPLFGLQLSTDLLLIEELDHDQKTMLEEISLSLKRSSDIIMNFSNLYKDSVEFTDVNLDKLINEVFTLTKSESRAIPKSTHFHDLDSSFSIKSNSTWLAQIIFNLIINSSQAMSIQKTASPKISIDITKSDSSVSLAFTDNGPGLNNDQLANAFTPFYTTKPMGTGLGLSISQSLAHKLGGTLNYVPEYRSGARFILELPL